MLEKLIDLIASEYLKINKKWINNEYYKEINLKKKTVSKIYDKNDILETIFNYRTFIIENNLDFSIRTHDYVNVSMRVKALNSIESKIRHYNKFHNDGQIPIAKCLNDLFGIRIILKDNIEYNIIKNLIDKKYSSLKCIDSSKDEYVAIHIYFQENNYTFPWELQIWKEKNEKANIASHEKYKREYAKWEQESKGGEVNW